MIKFGDRLKELRMSAGLEHLSDLGKLVGWTGNTSSRIGQYEDGTRYPKINDAKLLAKALNITFEELIKGTDYPHNPYLNEPETLSQTSGKIPLIIWHQIPNLFNRPDLLFDKNIPSINVSFPTEKNLFASKIPKTIVPGVSHTFFQPDDMLLISPSRKPASSQYIVIQEPDWLEPIFVQFWLQGTTPAIKYDGEIHLRKLAQNIQICGVVVARLNIFI